MKNLFITGAIIALSSCNTVSDHVVTPKACCDTTEEYSVDTTNITTPAVISLDSTATVTDLLDSLTNYEPAAEMTH